MSEDNAVAGETLVFEQLAEPKSFIGLSLKNGLLNLITLTLYRFWGKTEVRRRVWSSTYLNGDAFEYTGRGVELFLGFLLAVVALALPFLLIIFGIQFLGPLASLGILLFYPFLGYLLGFGQFSAFRYMASRSSWRGVRFGVSGTANGYAWAFLGYVVVTVFSLGWFWPAAARRLAGRMWGSLTFGDRKAVFDIERARQRSVYDAYLIAWVLGIIAYFSFIAVLFGIGVVDLERRAEPSLGQMLEFYLAFGVFALVYAAIYAVYRAAALESVVHGMSFEGARFELRITWADMAMLTVTNTLMTILSLGFLMPMVQARTVKFLFSRLKANGEVDVAAIRQTPDTGPRTGEGLADAFGLSPI
jgi:uncharacterized membrane protein YjgN (DUF898 family)